VPRRVFLLSPASCAGKRCQQLLDRRAGFALAARVRNGGAPLGEVFAFLSALYFRGKLAYARHFAAPPQDCPGVWVITPDRGLVPPDTAVTAEDLHAFARVPIDVREPRYAAPLHDAALALRARLPRSAEVVLLGSIATGKYVEILRPAFAGALRFPRAFLGRGDMSRGGLLLRAVREGRELDYRRIDALERSVREKNRARA
jgi:hypothetical protein